MQQKALTASEWIVMDTLWGKEPQVLAEIIDAIGDKVDWNYQTYASYLNVLCEKGFVGFMKRGRTKFYYALVEKDACIEAESKSILQKLSKESAEKLLLCMIRDTQLSEAASGKTESADRRTGQKGMILWKLSAVCWEISIYSIVLFLAVIAVKKVFRDKMSPALHFIVWFLLIARLCIPVTIDSGLRLFVIPEAASAETTQIPADAVAIGSDSASLSPGMQNHPGTQSTAQTQASADNITAQASGSPSTGLLWRVAALNWTDIVIVIWLGGIMLVMVWMFVAAVRLNRVIVKTGIQPPLRFRELLRKCRKDLGIRRDIPLYLLKGISTPALTIALKPRIVLPSKMVEKLNDQQLEFAIRARIDALQAAGSYCRSAFCVP